MAESSEHAPSEDGNSFLEYELEALRSIYINETNVYEDDETTTISIDLHPATADNLQEQYVKLTLRLIIKEGYPDDIPEIDIRNPRGLSDEKLSSITNALVKIAKDKRGDSMLFEIIEAAKDYLTAGNRPCEECAICLYGFHDEDIFTKTDCYHFFHSYCLARYAKTSSTTDEDSNSDDSSKNELLCPVCRLPIHFKGVDDSYPSPVKGDDEFCVTDTLLQTQKKLQELYIKQVEKGGIIDLEAEKNKYLIEISHVPSVVDAASEVKSEEEINLKLPEESDKTKSSSPREHSKNDKLDSRNDFSNRSHSDRSDRRFGKRGNDASRPYLGNNYRNDRYQSNRGSNGYRRDMRNGRNNYDRSYDRYNNDNRISNRGRNNWHDSQYKGNRFERPDKYDKNSQHYGREEGSSQRYNNSRGARKNEHNSEDFDDENSQNYKEPSNDDDKNSQKYDNERKKEEDLEEGLSIRDDKSRDIGQRSDDAQDEEIEKDDEKRNNRFDRRNTNYGRGHRNYQYDDRRDNRYDRWNVRYDNNKRYGRFEDSRNGQYDRRNDRFESRKYNEHTRRKENFAFGRNNRGNEGNRNRYSNQENEDRESKFKKNAEIDAKNTITVEEGNEHLSTRHEVEDDSTLIENEYHKEPITGSRNLSIDDDEVLESRLETKPHSSAEHRHNFPNRNSGLPKQNDSRNYNRHYQRFNSNGDRYNGASGYSKQSNYRSERRQTKPQNFRKNSNEVDGSENSNPLKSDAAGGAGEPNESSLEGNQVDNYEESGDFIQNQHSKKSTTKTDSGNTNQYKNYRDGKQGYNNRYPNNNENYQEARPYRNNPRSRNNQNDYTDRTSNGGKRFIPKKYGSDSAHNSSQTEYNSDVKHVAVSKESVVEPVPVEASSRKPTQVPPKSSDLEKSVPTSNFLPPMSSVVPPPGFLNPTRKIVYGLAAANPPPGFNKS